MADPPRFPGADVLSCGMKRYEPRSARNGWAVFDSLTRETLPVPQAERSREGVEAYSALLNDLESIGRHPAVEAQCEA